MRRWCGCLRRTPPVYTAAAAAETAVLRYVFFAAPVALAAAVVGRVKLCTFSPLSLVGVHWSICFTGQTPAFFFTFFFFFFLYIIRLSYKYALCRCRTPSPSLCRYRRVVSILCLSSRRHRMRISVRRPVRGCSASTGRWDGGEWRGTDHILYAGARTLHIVDTGRAFR